MKYAAIFIAAVVTTFMLPQNAFACAACYGSANSAAVQGLNMAILGMLGFMATVFGGMIAFAIRMRKRTQTTDNQA